MKQEKLEKIVAELVTKPGHEKVRALLYKLLTDGLGADSTRVDFESPVPEVRGRIDALLGRTVFEIKRDLARERTDAESQLSRYLPQREAETGHRFVGIATDGAEFRVYMVRDGRLDQLGQFKPKIAEPHGLLGWLESVVVVVDDVPADVTTIRLELGRDSIAYHRALREIGALWTSLADNAEANLKRDLWNRMFRVAYGGDIEAPGLFLQHTYLILLRHKSFRRACRATGAAQHGHRGRVLTRAAISRRRRVAMEFGTWRAGRSGGASGSVTVGYGKFREERGGTRS